MQIHKVFRKNLKPSICKNELMVHLPLNLKTLSSTIWDFDYSNKLKIRVKKNKS